MYRFSAQSYTQKRKQPNFYFLFKAALGAYDRLPTSIFNKKYRGEPFTLEKDTPLHFSAGPVSRVLSPDARVRISVIYLRRQSPAASSNLPPDIGRAALERRCTRSCNLRDVRPDDIAASAVGSYPAFSPLPPQRRSFSVTLLYPYGHQVVSLRGALCCSDFPPPPCGGSDRACLHGANIRIFSHPAALRPKARPGAGAPLFYRDCSGFMSFTRSCVLTVPR